jgi:hypothetical protein
MRDDQMLESYFFGRIARPSLDPDQFQAGYQYRSKLNGWQFILFLTRRACLVAHEKERRPIS